MNENIVYDGLMEIQRLAWENDDFMDQETLFDLQATVATLAYYVAHCMHKEDELCVAFPWVYR